MICQAIDALNVGSDRNINGAEPAFDASVALDGNYSKRVLTGICNHDLIRRIVGQCVSV
jgi:hypothetical protein